MLGLAKQHSINIIPHHVKSHQDNDRDFEDLGWQAQLNCICDRMVEETRECQHCVAVGHKHYSLQPGHGATRDFSGTYVTSHMAHAVKNASYQADLQAYILEQYGWTQTTSNLIGWTAREGAGRKRQKGGCNLTLFKLEWDLLATMSQRHKFERGVDHQCPQCRRFQEDFDHVLQCPLVAQNDHTSAWAIATSAVKARPTCIAVWKRIEDGIDHGLTTTSSPQCNSPCPSPDNITGTLIKGTFQDQNQIRWAHIFCKRISHQWGQANAAYCHERHNTAPANLRNAIWTQHLITALWQYSVTRWISCNEFLYGKTAEEQLLRKTTDISNKRIHSMYQRDQHKIRAVLSHLFAMPKITRLDHTLLQNDYGLPQWMLLTKHGTP